MAFSYIITVQSSRLGNVMLNQYCYPMHGACLHIPRCPCSASSFMAKFSLPSSLPSNPEPCLTFGCHVSLAFFSLKQSLSLSMTSVTPKLLMIGQLLQQCSIWVCLVSTWLDSGDAPLAGLHGSDAVPFLVHSYQKVHDPPLVQLNHLIKMVLKSSHSSAP